LGCDTVSHASCYFCTLRKFVFAVFGFPFFFFPDAVEAQPDSEIPKVSNNRYVIFPVIVKSPEYKWGAGLAGTYYFRLRKDSSTRTSNFKAVSFVTVRRQLVFASEGNIFFPSEKYILHTIASVSRFPDKFWGLGNTTPASNLENYAISQYDIYPQLLRKVYKFLFIGAGYEFQNVFEFDYDDSGQSLFDKENITGRKGGHISGTSFILTWDSRNNAFSPSKGFYAQYLVGTYQDFLGSQFNFTVQTWDVRKYFPLKKDRVFAMQFNMIITNGNVPIRNMANIGSSSYLRGYYEGRYTDQDVIAIQGEYRTPVWGRFGLVFFSGTGKVASRFVNLIDFSHLKPSFGVGVRFALNPKEKLNLRVDAGFGDQSQGTYINMGEAF
jgi:Omp85 superfamily domain